MMKYTKPLRLVNKPTVFQNIKVRKPPVNPAGAFVLGFSLGYLVKNF